MVGGTLRRAVRTFKTIKDLMASSEWMAAEDCTRIATGATATYRSAVWHVLSDSAFALSLANAAHIKNVRGRKTDANDATWLADLMGRGLIWGSFVPDAQTRSCALCCEPAKQFARERSSHVQRLRKTLEDANIRFTRSSPMSSV
jgi:transposase